MVVAAAKREEQTTVVSWENLGERCLLLLHWVLLRQTVQWGAVDHENSQRRVEIMSSVVDVFAFVSSPAEEWW